MLVRTFAVVILSIAIATSLIVYAAVPGFRDIFPLQVGPAITFTAIGDIGATANTATVLQGIAASGSQFTMTLGDLSYNDTGTNEPTDGVTPSPWCNYVKTYIPNAGTSYPFQLIAGNHDDDGSRNPGSLQKGHIDNIAVCLPNMIGTQGATGLCGSRSATYGLDGCYGTLYYTDYPATSPVMRIISMTTDCIDGNCYNYAQGSATWTWVSQRIDEAKTQGLWVVTANHQPCLAIGSFECTSSDYQNLAQLFVQKKVDLVLNAHEHYYARTKQLSCFTSETYVPSCIVNDTNSVVRGAGTVIVTAGTGGRSISSPIDAADPEYSYFVSAANMGNNLNRTFGYLKLTVNSERLSGQFVGTAAGTFTDSFEIVQPVQALTGDFTWSPASPKTGETVTFTGTVSGGTSPYVFNWAFGDGSTGTGQTVTKTFVVSGSYVVVMNITDAAATRFQVSHSVTVSTAVPLSTSFTWTPANPTTGQTVTFTSATSGGTAPYLHSWTFGDGGSANGASVTHTYTTIGQYTVVVTVTDATGNTVTSQNSLVVTSPPPQALVAGFTWDPLYPTAGQLGSFTATVSGGTQPYYMSWDFGDGSATVQTTDFTVSHVFLSANDYNVQLSVSDSGGQTTRVNNTVSALTSGATSVPTLPFIPFVFEYTVAAVPVWPFIIGGLGLAAVAVIVARRLG